MDKDAEIERLRVENRKLLAELTEARHQLVKLNDIRIDAISGKTIVVADGKIVGKQG